MTKSMTLAAAIALLLATTGIASAQSDHGHDGESGKTDSDGAMESQPDMMKDMMQMMMPMMMRMMGGAMMGMGPADTGSMMDRDAMQMMMGPGIMGPGMTVGPSSETMIKAASERLAEFDADGDGSLSLVEFEALHAAMTRETMVDRFQHLDSDGDGMVSKDEMAAPAMRMGMQRMMRNSAGEEDDKESSDN